jgi:hypothetical protein
MVKWTLVGCLLFSLLVLRFWEEILSLSDGADPRSPGQAGSKECSVDPAQAAVHIEK